jgi:hypothetical protein
VRRHFPHVLAIAAIALGALAIPAAAGATPPANDDFANATVIGGAPFSDAVDITEATAEAGEPQVCNFSSQTIWAV